MKIGVVGLGLMGASFAAALSGARPGYRVVGVDSDPETVVRALERGLIEEPTIAEADVIVVAVPPAAVQRVLEGLPRDRLVTDMTSTKARVGEWAAAAGLDFVGGHPMCGSEASGIAAADPDLFRGAVWVVTRSEPAVDDLVRAVGATPVVMAAERHDRLVGAVSHAAFALSAAYLLALSESPDWPELGLLAGGGFRDMTRLAAGSPEMYAGIAATNPANLAAWLEQVERQIAKLRRHIVAGDVRLVELFEEARDARLRWKAARP